MTSAREQAAGHVAVVTDSAACLPAGMTGRARLRVVPLRLLAGGQAADDAGDGLPAAIEDQLRRGHRLLTSRPSPAAFAAAYQDAARAGAGSVVSVHLSAGLSGTLSSARLAARDAPIPVRVVDSQSIGVAEGLAVLAALAAARAGRDAAGVAAAAARLAADTGSFFALDSLQALFAGGRLASGPAGAPAGLVCRPVLAIRGGRVHVMERLRTRSAAADLVAELAAGFAAGRPADMAVQHTGCQDRAMALMERLARAIPAGRPLGVLPAGAAIRSHTGLGMVGVALAPAEPPG